MERGGRRIGFSLGEVGYDLASALRPYHFESLPADLFPRLDRDGASFVLQARADLVLYRMEFRLEPGRGTRRDLAWSFRRGLASGRGTTVAQGRESFEPALFTFTGPRGGITTASLRRPLDLAFARVEGSTLLGGRLRPVTPEFRPMLPRLSLPVGMLDGDLFTRVLSGGVDLPAAAGGDSAPLRLEGAFGADRATIRLAGAEGGPLEAAFALPFPYADAAMVASTRARDFAEATILLVAEHARFAHRDRPFTLAPPGAADPLAREELALFDAWLAAAAAPVADPDLAAFDRTRRNPHGD